MTETTQNQSMLKNTASVGVSILALLALLAAVYGLRNGTIGELVWFLAMIVVFIVRVPHGKRNQANQIAGHKKDPMEQLVLTGMFLTMSALPTIELATRLFSFASYTLPEWAMWSGAVLQLPFIWLFWRSHADLGRNWSPGLEVRQDHALVTRGVYARIRHPMYAAIWLSAIAQPLLIQNWIAGFLVLPMFAALYLTRIPKEEAMMLETFGEDYKDYCARTGRIWPSAGELPSE